MAIPDHTIGGVSVLILAGSESVKGRAQEIAVVRRPGISGFTVRGLGVQASPFQIRTFRDCTDAADSRDQETAFLNMKGLIKALKGPDGQTDNVFVHSVRCERFAIFAATGFIKSTPAWAIEADWVLEFITT